MKFTQSFSVRWHETDQNLIATPSAILTYMQETANTQCETLGPSLQALRDEQGIGFVVSRLSMRVYSPIRVYDQLEVSTYINEPKGFRFLRGFEIRRNGEKVAEAVSLWVLLDLHTHTFVRGNQIRFGIAFEEMPDLGLPTHIRFPAETEPSPLRYAVSYFDTDYNGHINNTHYPNLVCGFLPEIADRPLSSLTLSYVTEARRGELLDAVTAKTEENGEDVFYVRTLHEDGRTNADARITLMPL